MEDGLIIDLYFERNERAIYETDLKYGKKLIGISKNITESTSDAEECVNDSYLATWNQIPPTRPSNLFAFLCRIVRNISYNRFHMNTAKKRNASVSSLCEELNALIPDPNAVLPEEENLGKAIDRFLRDFCDKENRMLFVRRYFYADSLSDLAKMTGLEEAKLSLRLHRIRKKLKIFLEKEGFTV